MVGQQLAKGGNRPLTGSSVRVAVTTTGLAVTPDLIVLCVGAGGKVRTDADLVFYNQPKSPDGSVQLTAQGLTVDLPAVSDGVDRLIIAVSLDAPLTVGAGLVLQVMDDGLNFSVPTEGLSTERAVMLAEIYRRQSKWKLRNISQGYESGLAGLARDHGVSVDDVESPPSAATPAAATPAAATSAAATSAAAKLPSITRTASAPTTQRSARVPSPHEPATAAPATPRPSHRPADSMSHTSKPDWYPDYDSGWLRWWDGSRWTDERTPASVGPDRCGRCGQQLRARRFGGGYARCKTCENQVATVMASWRPRAAEVVLRDGPVGTQWDNLWVELRHARIAKASGGEAIREYALDHLQRQVTFAFADGRIDHSEIDRFESLVTAFEVADPAIDAMRLRLARGFELTNIRDGNLPVSRAADIHLDIDEILHLDVRATHVRILVSGPKENPGRLLITNKKLRFIGSTMGGAELTWPKVVTVRAAYGSVGIEATTARGAGSYRTDDPDYAAAVIEGALRVSKRLVLSPGGRDSATIPQHVKAAVWQRDRGRCVQCGDNAYLEFDHVIPRSKGGATSERNIQLLCRRCNQQKSDRI